jgi:hypothetical protein
MIYGHGEPEMKYKITVKLLCITTHSPFFFLCMLFHDLRESKLNNENEEKQLFYSG